MMGASSSLMLPSSTPAVSVSPKGGQVSLENVHCQGRQKFMFSFLGQWSLGYTVERGRVQGHSESKKGYLPDSPIPVDFDGSIKMSPCKLSKCHKLINC